MKVLITGASSGIGKALAEYYAREQHQVYACGRNQQVLSQMHQQTGVLPCVFDVCDLEDIQVNTKDIGQLDVLVLNAGNCEYIDEARQFDSALFERVIRVNVLSLGYCLEALLPRLKTGGQLVIVSSSVVFVPLTRSEAYGASKAAASYLAKSLAVDLSDVHVSLVHPGFVKTPLTDKNGFPMPWRISSDKAAEYIAKGIRKRRREIHFPYRFTLILKLLNLLPWPWLVKISRGLAR